MTFLKEIQSTFSVDQQQPLPPPPSESAVEPQAEQKASNEQDEVEIQQVSKPKKERKYDIHKEKKRKEEKKAVTDAAPEKLKPQLHKIKTEKVSEPELHRIKTEEAPEPLLAEKEQPIEFLETPILEPVKETVVESPAEKQTISEPPAEEQKIIEPPIVDEPVAKVTESLFKEEAPTIGLSARITEPLDVDALVTESKEVEETTSTEAISEPEPSKEENVNVEFRLHSPKRHRDVPTSEPDTLPSEDANAVVEESIKTVDEQASDTIISPPLAKSQLSTEEISEQTTLSEQHVEYEFSQTKKTKSTTQSSTNESERQFQHEKPSSELESIQSHTHDDLPLSEIPAETAPSVTKDTDHQANDEVPSPGVKRLQSIASYHEGDACDPSEWDDNESVDVESPLKEPVKKIILSASDDAIPSLKADESGEEKESATVTITTTKDRAGIEGMETVMMMDKGDGVDPINLSMERVSSVAGGDDILDISASTNENHAEAGSAISGGNDDETLSANGRPLSVDAESLAADDEHILDEALQTTYGMHG